MNPMDERVDHTSGHRLLPHTADVIVEAWARSRARCLEELVRGIVESFADTREIAPAREIPLEIGAPDDADVVIGLVGDVCYLLDADGLVVVEVALEEEEDGNFDGTFFVAPVAGVPRTGAPPKGISRSGLQFDNVGASWRARVLLDV